MKESLIPLGLLLIGSGAIVARTIWRGKERHGPEEERTSQKDEANAEGAVIPQTEHENPQVT